LGFKLLYTAPDAWPIRGGGAVPLHVMGMMRRDWRVPYQ
jgi:hypothetical protein